MNSLASALTANSPRLSPPPTPLASILIHGSVLLLWLLLFAASFKLGGVLAWGVGIAYIVYDTVLLLFVGWQSRRLLRPAVAPAAHWSAPPTSAKIRRSVGSAVQGRRFQASFGPLMKPGLEIAPSRP